MKDKIILSGNCYWTLEAAFQRVKGVSKVTSGVYQLKPYDFKFNDIDRVECVELEFDTSKVSLDTLLNVFYELHNPNINTWNKDTCFAYAYRSSIIVTKEQKEQAVKKIADVTASQKFGDSSSFGGSINTKVIMLMDGLFEAGKDQNFYNDNPVDPYCTSMVDPKLEKLESLYPGIFIKGDKDALIEKAAAKKKEKENQ